MGASESRPGEFNSKTTATQALDNKDLSGKIAIVTGANTGIGKETARCLLAGNATVVMACRSLERGGAAREDIINSFGDEKTDAEDRLKLIQLDLGDLDSVKQFCDDFNALDIPCHYLVQNAGVMAFPEYGETKQGIERQWGINHLGHFYMANLLLPRLQQDTPSRLIALSSSAQSASPPLDEWFATHGGEKPHGPTPEEYAAWGNYGLSKMSNILFAQEFNRRYFDSGVTGVSVHPGVIATELGRNIPKWQFAIFKTVGGPFFKSVPQGAATTVRCVALSDEEISPGSFYADCQVAEIRQDGRPRPNVAPEETPAFKLWQMSADILGGLGYSV